MTVPTLGLIGCGSWGSRYAAIAFSDPKIQITRIFDTDKLQAKSISHVLPDAQICENLSEILEDKTLDAVLIITPTPTHHSLVLKALQCGKHVFVEKPIAVNLIESLDMVKTAQKENKFLMVGQILRFMPAIEQARSIVQSGKLGKLLHLSERRYGRFRKDAWPLWWTEMTGFLLLHLGSHSIDAILWMTNQNPQWVFAQGQSRKVTPQHGAIDAFTLSMGLESDVLVGVDHEAYGGYPGLVYDLVIIGELGTLVLDGFNRLLMDQKEIFRQDGDIYTQALTDELHEFINAIITNQNPKVTGYDLIPTVATLDAARKSLSTGNIERIVY